MSVQRPRLISNSEVMEVLEERVRRREGGSSHGKKRSSTTGGRLRHRDWIEEKVVEYLQSTPCVKLDTSRRQELQSKLTSTKRINTADGSRRTSGYGLMEAESIQILNFMPTELVEIHLMIEELHARMSEDKQEELLATIGSYIKQEGKEESAEEEVVEPQAAAAASQEPSLHGDEELEEEAEGEMELEPLAANPIPIKHESNNNAQHVKTEATSL